MLFIKSGDFAKQSPFISGGRPGGRHGVYTYIRRGCWRVDDRPVGNPKRKV
jgi:hypothetical protein